MAEWKDIAPFMERVAGLSDTGLCACGADGTLVYAGGAIAGITGRSVDEISRMNNISEISPDLERMLAAVVRDGAVSGKECLLSDAQGNSRVLVCSAAMAEVPGTGPAAVFLLHDNTRCGRQPSEGEWHAIIESLEDGYYECDLKGIFLVANSAMHRITGSGPGELIGQCYTSFYSPEEAKRIYEAYHEVFVTGNPARLINFMGITKGGRQRKIEGSISPIRKDGGGIRGFRGILRDVSDKSRIEKELLRARKMEAIGILAGGIAHDYNNALTAILGNISLAKMETDPSAGSMMEYLNDAEQASMKAVDLTRRLSTFARGGKPERNVVDCTDTVRSTVDSVLAGYPGTHQLIIHDDLWKVDIDEFQIGQVVTYILNNAVESMAEPGPITVTVENTVVKTEESHHEMSLQPGNFVRITIGDRGAGIEPENIQNIFDPYYTTKEMASGMGLATSYAIIKRHHGYIDVRSTPGTGSSFFIYLPVVR
jgi:PAS domain S-box-containing protein